MQNLYARAVFFVENAERAQRDYVERLGFTADWAPRGDDDTLWVCQVSLHGFEVILNQVWGDSVGKQGRGRVYIGLEKDQQEPILRHIKEKNIPTERRDWGQPTLVIRDLDGNEIFFWDWPDEARLAQETPTAPEPGLAARIAAVATLRGEFTLRSGVVANEYFDKYRFESDPTLLTEIARRLVAMIPDGTDALAGLELGGVPIATAMALNKGLPTVFVRKHAKEYGTCQLAEGRDVKGLHLLIVEDVVTSGGQVIASANDLRALGAIVTDAVCVIDRESGGKEALAAAGITLHSLFTKSDLTPRG